MPAQAQLPPDSPAPTAPSVISIVVPCHNEAANLEPLYRAIREALKAQPQDFELIFVDDGSTDDTVKLARQMQRAHPEIRIIELVRNFGKELAVSAGVAAARGAAVVIIDADLQHPPALIPELIKRWRGGAEVVIGVRANIHRRVPVAKRIGSKMFYRLMNAISNVKLVAGATDYRLLDRIVVDEFNRFTEHGRIARGLIDWLGYRREYVKFQPAARHAGEAAYTYYKLINLAMTSFISMSFFPLKVAGYLGLIIVLISGPLGAFIFVEKYMFNDRLGLAFSGPAILAVILVFLVGIMLVCLGLMSLYIATIHTEVMNRPLYVARPEQRPPARHEA